MPSLFTSVSWPAGRKPRRARMLERLDNVMPWTDLAKMLEPHYPAPALGRKPYPLIVMVKVYMLQVIFGLSDESVEDLILDSHSAATFVGIDPWKPRPPGATAIARFRAIVERFPDDGFRFAMHLVMLSARLELRHGKIREPVLKIKPGGYINAAEDGVNAISAARSDPRVSKTILEHCRALKAERMIERERPPVPGE